MLAPFAGSARKGASIHKKNMFPNNAITKSIEVSGNVTNTFEPSGKYTILGFSTQQENTASLTQLRCGSTVVATNYAVSLDQQLMWYQCNGTLNINKTGNDKSFNIITYVQGFLSEIPTTTVGYNPSTNIATTTDVKIYGSISAGEVLIAFLLFSMIVIKLTTLIARGLDKIKSKKEYLAYGGGDVEIKNDI